jgi:Protein of unknown function (DUF3307)
MIEAVILLLVLLQIKHWYIDFVNQSNEEVASKGIYGDRQGIMHSAKHGFGTLACILFIVGLPYLFFAVVLAVIDFVIHYHIDWLKMNYGNRDITTPAFWNHLGLDQMMHQITYLFIAYMMV